VDRSKLLLAISFIIGCLISTLNVGIASAASGSCSTAAAVAGLCTGAQTSNNSVDVWARTTTPSGSSSVVVPIGRTTNSRPVVVTPVFYPSSLAFKCLGLVSPSPQCRRTPAPPAPAPVAYAPITLSDLANFVPQAATLTSQPRGWTVVNLNTNFIAGVSTHVVGGSLFGRSAEVRFTPHAYEWNYGDGGTQITSVPGARWDALGLREFSPTATSHVYGSEGSFTTTVAVRYGAEYRIGGGEWVPVDGEVSSSATATVVIVQGADTVLAARDCTANHTAPGC
jgi:hypothetical protein